MVKVIVSNNDPVMYTLLDELESNDLFGSDYIEDYGIEISENLLKEYKETYKNYLRIQKEIGKIVSKS